MDTTSTKVSHSAETQNLRKFEKVCEILSNFEYDPNKLIPMLQQIQEEYRYLPTDIMTFVASSLDISPARVYGVATFYSHFALEPKGKYIIKVCDGTACHVRHSQKIIDAIGKKLDLNEKKTTSEDLLFTLEIVSCLGACGIAPVIVINDDVYGNMTPENLNTLIDKIIMEEENA